MAEQNTRDGRDNNNTATGSKKAGFLGLAIILALIGMGVSIYSIAHHRQVKATGSSDAFCNINATVNCDEVASSAYAEIANLPLGVFGLGYFAALAVLAAIGLTRWASARDHVHAYVALVAIGVLTSLGLFGLSVFGLGHVCLTCVGVYVITFLQLGLVVVGRQEFLPGLSGKSVFSGGSSAAVVVALVAAAYSYLVPQVIPVTKPGSANQKTEIASKAEDIPVARSAYVGLGEDYRKGPDDAKVVIVEFADYQCPACRAMGDTLESLAAEFPGKIQIVFRNFPLDSSCNSGVRQKMHEFACRAAVMARCAGQYGKFWDLNRALFANQKDLSDAKIKDLSRQVGLNDEQINACWDNADLIAKVKDDADLGNRVGVDSTPTLFINGHKVLSGRGINELRAQVEALLN